MNQYLEEYRSDVMMGILGWALTFLIISAVAGVFGYSGLAGTALGIAKVLFGVAMVFFILSVMLFVTFFIKPWIR